MTVWRRKPLLRSLFWVVTIAVSLLATLAVRAATPESPHRKILLIAGSKSKGPGLHEYVKSARLLKVLLDRAGLKNVETIVVYDGWPANPAALDSADTIVLISDGMQWSPWSFSAERIAAMQKQIDRGCGLFSYHFPNYVPYRFQKQGLAWTGGYVEYDGPKHPEMYFTQKTLASDVLFPSPKHPVMNGVKPFHISEEFYYKASFVPGREGITPLVRVPELPADPKVFPGPLAGPEDQITMWAYDRPNAAHSKTGGRSVAATMGHFYATWQNDDYRKLMLNAILWSAHIDVPKDGVPSTWVNDSDVDRVLGPPPTPIPSPLEPPKLEPPK